MNDDQFLKLFKYIEDFRNEVHDKFEDTTSQSSLDSLTNAIDHFVSRLDAKEAARDAQFAHLR
jgi:flagellar capping protein FliD